MFGLWHYSSAPIAISLFSYHFSKINLFWVEAGYRYFAYENINTLKLRVGDKNVIIDKLKDQYISTRWEIKIEWDSVTTSIRDTVIKYSEKYSEKYSNPFKNLVFRKVFKYFLDECIKYSYPNTFN